MVFGEVMGRVEAKEMGTVGDADRGIEMLMDAHTAFGERDTEL